MSKWENPNGAWGESAGWAGWLGGHLSVQAGIARGRNRPIPAIPALLGPIPGLVCRDIFGLGLGEKIMKKIRGFLENTS